MGWLELQSWLGAMTRQNEPPGSDPGSWQGTEADPWWAQARRQRDAERAG